MYFKLCKILVLFLNFCYFIAFLVKKLLTYGNYYYIYLFVLRGYGGTGRRARLKILWPQAVSVRV